MIEQVEKLTDIAEPYHGQTVWCSDEDKCYRYDAIEGWQEVSNDGQETSIGMNMYDINKQIISQLPPMSEESISEKLVEIKNCVDDLKNTFYMLLCRDVNYYTVFMIDGDANEKFEDVLLECLKTFGQIKAIDEVDGAFEIWIENDLFENGPYVFYFFPYDIGVERCK